MGLAQVVGLLFWVRKDPVLGLLVSSVVQTAHCRFTFFLFV